MLQLAPALKSQVQDHALHYRARCYKISLTVVQDVVYRFTDHSEPLVLFDGQTYEAAKGVESSANRREQKAMETNREVRGLITSDTIKDRDLRQGIFNDAIVDEYVVDFRLPFIAPIDHVRYTIRSMTFDGSFWTADIAGAGYRLTRPVGDVWGPMCRADLFSVGPGKCNASSAPFVENNTILLILEDQIHFRINNANNALWLNLGYGADGRVIFHTGQNAGFTTYIKKHELGPPSTVEITLQQRTPYSLSVSDAVTLFPGCNKRFNGDCLNKFDNVVNFQGEPFIPGGDAARKGVRIRVAN